MTIIRKLLLLIVLFKISHTTAQNSINEIACFTVNKTGISIVNELTRKYNLKAKELRTEEDFTKIISKRDKLGELLTDEAMARLPGPLQSKAINKQQRIFYIPAINDKACSFTNLYLVFENELLTCIYFDYSNEVVTMLENKNGNVEMQRIEKQVNCQLSYGTSFKENELLNCKDWKVDNILCRAAFGEVRDKHCNRVKLSYIFIGENKFLNN